jgi:phosphoglycolate phosphatase-like HAD superfamily hydrolase
VYKYTLIESGGANTEQGTLTPALSQWERENIVESILMKNLSTRTLDKQLPAPEPTNFHLVRAQLANTFGAANAVRNGDPKIAKNRRGAITGKLGGTKSRFSRAKRARKVQIFTANSTFLFSENKKLQFPSRNSRFAKVILKTRGEIGKGENRNIRENRTFCTSSCTRNFTFVRSGLQSDDRSGRMIVNACCFRSAFRASQSSLVTSSFTNPESKTMSNKLRSSRFSELVSQPSRRNGKGTFCSVNFAKRASPRRFRYSRLIVLLFALTALQATAADKEKDPLPSWNDGANKQAILDFVAAVTKESGAEFVPVAERIATFDQDGTLWCEQPNYTQVVFAIDRVKALAPQHPEWKTTEPFKSILDDDKQALLQFTIQDFAKVAAISHTGMTVEEFQAIAKQWLATAEQPRFHRHYTDLIYQPMLEVMQYLRANKFKTYIVTGGGQDFVRVYAERVYGVPPEQVIGSAVKTKYEYAKNGAPELIKQPEMMLIDDKTGKPEGINLFIGRRPVAAFGNSTGDQQMLEWTQGKAPSSTSDSMKQARLMMLVHHDDAVREYAYGADSKIGTFSAALTDEAKERHWNVISMKNDWKTIFPADR